MTQKKIITPKKKVIAKKILATKEQEQQGTNIPPEQMSTLQGYIEAFKDGQLYGWAYDSKAPNDPLEIDIFTGQQLLGKGIANIERNDLKEAGYGNGAHGFVISLERDKVIEDKELKILTRQNSTPIDIGLYKIPTLKQFFKVYIDNIIGNKLSFSIVSDKSIGNKILAFSCENKVFSEKEININTIYGEEYIYIPSELLDNQEHLIEVRIQGYAKRLGALNIQLKTILTPWQYLKESYKQPGFLSLPRHADRRYESLNYHLDAMSSDKGLLSLKNLHTVHNLVVESYEGRSKFPTFSLPTFKKPIVSIIVPAYNKFELTYHCIASIALAYNKISYEVILADDCSTDKTVDAEKIIENLVISKNPENLRFLKSCNAASKIAKGQYIIFLNNDTEVTSFWIDELINQHERDPNVGLTGSKLLNSDGSLQEAGGIIWGSGQPWNVGRNANPLQPEYNYVRQVDYLSGAALCISKVLWQKVGRFSEELAPAYYEDTDLAFKVREAGYKTLYAPQSEVIHFEGKSHGTDVTKGLKRYQVINEKTFRAKWFKDFKYNGKPSLEAMKLEKDRNIDQRILVIDYATPMPNKDAGSYAAIQEIKLIISLGFKVTFVPENLAHFGKFTTQLQHMGVEVLYAPFYTSLDEVLNLRLAEMDGVYITRYAVAEKYLQRIRQSNAKILFNNADLHFLRKMRAALINGTDKQALDYALQTRDKELAVCKEVDAVLTYNTTEHAVITSHILEAEKLHITPWVLEEKTPGPSFKNRQGIVFLGGYNHKPNIETVEYLVNDIMPLLFKQRPDICLYVYGSNMPEYFIAYEADNIKIIGFAEHLDDVYHNHRVFVAPLLSGAGIKGKVLESMAYGMPIVLTDIAAEGTGLTHGVSALIAQKPEEWVEAIIKLYDDEKLWNRFSENELTLATENYSFEHGQKVFKDIFASVGLYTTH